MKKASKVNKNQYCGRYHGNGLVGKYAKQKAFDLTMVEFETRKNLKPKKEDKKLPIETLAEDQVECPKDFTEVLVENFNEIKA